MVEEPVGKKSPLSPSGRHLPLIKSRPARLSEISIEERDRVTTGFGELDRVLGGGVVLGASFLSILGLPIDLMGPISGFYRLLDMAFTTINVEGDVAANLMISKSIGEYDGSMAK